MHRDKPNGGLNGTSLVLIFPFSGHEPAGCNKGPLKSAILHSGSPSSRFFCSVNIAISYADLRSEHCYRNRKTFSSKKVYLVREREKEREMALHAQRQNERIGESIGNVPLEPEIFFLSMLHWAVYSVVRGYRRRRKGRKYERCREKKDESDLAVNIRGTRRERGGDGG